MQQPKTDADRLPQSVDHTLLDNHYRTAFALCRAKGVAATDHKQNVTWRSRFGRLLPTKFGNILRAVSLPVQSS